jgi:ribosome-binding factor A
MPTQRQRRVNSLLQEEISAIIQRELPQPELRLTSISSVEVSPDLRHARVFVSTLGEEEVATKALGALKRARKLIQERLGEHVELRFTPRLTFIADHTAARAQRIESLLHRIADEPPLPEAPALTLLEDNALEALDELDEADALDDADEE